MSGGWENLSKPEGVGDINETDDGFQVSISIPTDEDGYFGRECPACESPFKMRHDEYEALPDEVQLACPYCGHREEHSAFMSSAQHARVTASAEGLVEQWLHGEVNDMLGRTFGRQASKPRRLGSFISIDWSYTPGTPPPVRELPAAVEEQTRRIVECSTCGNHHAVYSATSFCPVCGPRPATEKVGEAITAAREALAVEDRLREDERETLRAAGVFERFAVDAIESTVSLFEMFAREQFTHRIDDAVTHTAGRGNIFQRLDDTADLFFHHADLDLVKLAGSERWERLKSAFARRHVLTHNGGIVDQKFLDRVPDSGLRLGQRLVVRRTEAAQALDDVEAVVLAVSVA
jgi:DNA-directed RNA polymerase subunit M/transcription elongation factor TFIIS